MVTDRPVKLSKKEVRKRQQEKADDLDVSIKKAKASATNEFNDDENSPAGQMYKTSKTMKELNKRLGDAYKTRNKVYDDYKAGRIDDDELYNAGKKFEDEADRVIKEMLGKAKNTPVESLYSEKTTTAERLCKDLVERADWHDIGAEGYHDMAWLYWH